jgi:hypothetical protein
VLHRYSRLIVYLIVLSLGTLTQASVSHAGKKRLYDWSSYERDAYLLAKSPSPENAARFEATLRRIISNADDAGRKPAPGLLAEIGYFFYQRGEFASAMDYFERERATWPESATLMSKMIQRSKEGAAQ